MLLLAVASALAADEPAVGTVPAPIPLGVLDKAHIDGVIKSHKSEIQSCYQRVLIKEPDLAGQVVVKFVISKDGTVSSATTKYSSLGAPKVEDCIHGRFMRFKFDEPTGGGIVIVSYPFIFTPEDTGPGLYTAHATLDDPPEGTPAGTLEMSAIDGVVEGAATLEALLGCRAAGLRETPGLWGEIVVQLVITETGRVSSVATKSSTMRSPSFEACVNSVFEGLQFPPPTGNGVVVVSYPLVFAPPKPE